MSPAAPAAQRVRAFLRQRRLIRWLVFAVIVVVVLVWVTTVGEEQEAMARSFLRGVLRHVR